jgi:hypothetical protein
VGTTYTLSQRLWVAQREMALLDGPSGPNVTEAV